MNMSERIEPALTAGEIDGDHSVGPDGRWDHAKVNAEPDESEGLPFLWGNQVCITYDSGVVAQQVQPRERHRLAALALINQSFGFTREDVNLLSNVSHELKLAAIHAPEMPTAMLTAINSLAERIEALLPGEK